MLCCLVDVFVSCILCVVVIVFMTDRPVCGTQ